MELVEGAYSLKKVGTPGRIITMTGGTSASWALASHLMPALVGLLMATLALGAILALMVSWASPAHLVPVLAGS